MSNSLFIYFLNGQRTATIAQFCPRPQPLLQVMAKEEILSGLFSTLDGKRSHVLGNASFWNDDVEVYL